MHNQFGQGSALESNSDRTELIDFYVNQEKTIWKAIAAIEVVEN